MTGKYFSVSILLITLSFVAASTLADEVVDEKLQVIPVKKAPAPAKPAAPQPMAAPAMAPAAEAIADKGWFVGLGIGQSENKDYDCSDCGAAIGSLDDSGSATKIFGGYRFNKYFAILGGYANLSDTDATGVGAAWTDKLEVDGFYGAVQGILPVNDKIDVFATLGMFSWDQKVTFDGLSGSFDGNDEFYGIGASYSFSNPGFKIQAEWNRFNDVGNTDPYFMHVDDYDLLTVNAVYQF